MCIIIHIFLLLSLIAWQWDGPQIQCCPLPTYPLPSRNTFSISFRWSVPDYNQCLWPGSSWSCLWFSCGLASDLHWAFALFHHNVSDYNFVSLWCFTDEVEDPYADPTFICGTSRKHTSYLYNFHPLKPAHFYIVKLGFAGVIHYFSYFCSKT